MQRLLIALAISVLPSFALAHGGGHGGGGHGGGGHGGGGHMSGGWGGHVGHASAAVAGAHMSHWSGRAGSWGHNHGRFVHRHGRVFFVGGPWWGSYAYYGYDCWRWAQTPWGLRRVWVCGDFY